MLVCFFHFAREAVGALGTRDSLRPLFSLGGWILQNSGASRRGNAESYFEIRRRHCEERSDEAIHAPIRGAKLWIASLSLSSGAHSRDPLARNDGFKTRHTPVVIARLDRATQMLWG